MLGVRQGMKLFTIAGLLGHWATGLEETAKFVADVRFIQPRQNTVVGSQSGLAPSRQYQANFDDVVRFRSRTATKGSSKCWHPSRDTTNRTSRELLCNCDNFPCLFSASEVPGEGCRLWPPAVAGGRFISPRGGSVQPWRGTARSPFVGGAKVTIACT